MRRFARVIWDLYRLGFSFPSSVLTISRKMCIRDSYDTEEGCLSLSGTRPVRRWNSIKVRWQNEQFQTRIKTFTGWTAQIIQHEIDHCEGILI